jgi:hypothetical protein
LSWISKLCKASAISCALLGAQAVLAETIVVRSNGPSAKSYPPGKSIADNSMVTLKAGDSVTILDGRGTRVLKGPGKFSTTATSGAATGSAIGQLLRNTGTRQARTGAVRGIGVARTARSPNLWYVDVSKSGKVCLADPASVSVWRPSLDQATTLNLTRVSDGKSAALEFRQGQSVGAWPVATLPARSGEQFRVTGGGLSTPTMITFAALGPNPQGLEGTASALIQNGCSNQLDLLVETVAIPSGEPSPTG